MGVELVRARNETLGAFAAIAVATLFTWTQVFPLDGLMEMGTDYGQMAWNMWAVDREISAGRSPLHTDAMFHPAGTSLAAHVLVPGYWPVTALVKLWRGSTDLLYPIYAYKIAIWLAYGVIVWATWRFLRATSASRLAAATGTLGYAFCSFNQFHAPHLNHLATAALLPLLGSAIVSLWAKGSRRSFIWVALLLGTGPYFGELVIFAWVSLALFFALSLLNASTRETLRSFFAARRAYALGAIMVFIVTVVPFVRAWTQSRAESMPSRQAWFWSANVAGLVIPDPQFQPALAAIVDATLPGHPTRAANSQITKGVGGREVFLGFSVILGTLLACGICRDFWTRTSLGVGVFFLVLSLGPSLKVLDRDYGVPLLYQALAVVPPFSMGRTPVRCVLFAIFFFSIAATRAWSQLENRGRLGRAVSVAAFGIAFLGAWSPHKRASSFESPLDLSKLVPGAVCNIPLSTVDGFAVLLQTQHRRPIVTGLVSRRSRAQADEINRLGDLLDNNPPAFAADLIARGAPNVILGPGAPDHLIDILPALGLNVIDLRQSRGKLQ